MILAAGLTPAWQQILVFDQLVLGEVNRAGEAHWCASGKVLNVGRALRSLEAESRTLALLGGPYYERIDKEFDHAGAARRWVRAERDTRICTTLLDRATGSITELVENAAAVSAAELEAFVEAYTAEAAVAQWVVLSGSLPPGTPHDFYRTLIERTAGQVLLDARGPELLAALDARPFLVKPNRHELARTLGRSLPDDVQLLTAMRELNARGARWVLVTDGARRAWLTSPQGAFRCQPAPIRPKNPIGSGDCLAAGIAWALSTGRDCLEAMRLGMAAAAENALVLLPARFDRHQVVARARQLQIEPVPPAGE